ncbi:uncharacterized protein MELLADRAFT_106194, partial [Melampsora larici-populina 98AG31]
MAVHQTFGKVIHTWNVDRHPDLPLGPPSLMMSYTKPEMVNWEQVKKRDEEQGVDTADRSKIRAGYLPLDYAKNQNADKWMETGKQVQFESIERPLKGGLDNIELTHCALLRKGWEEPGLSSLGSMINDDGSHIETVAHVEDQLQPILKPYTDTSDTFPMSQGAALLLADRGLKQFLNARKARLSRKAGSLYQSPDHSISHQPNDNDYHLQQSINSQGTTLEPPPIIIEPDYEGWVPESEVVARNPKKPRVTSPEGPASLISEDKSRLKSSNPYYPLPPPIPSFSAHGQNSKTRFSSLNELDSFLHSDSDIDAGSVGTRTMPHSYESSGFLPSLTQFQPNPIHQDSFEKGHLTISPPDYITTSEPSVMNGPHTPQYRETVLLDSPTTITHTPNSAVSHGADFISPTRFQMRKTISSQDGKDAMAFKPSTSSDSQFQSYNTARNSPEVLSHNHEHPRTSQLSDSTPYPRNPTDLKFEIPLTPIGDEALRSFHIALRIYQSLAREIEKAAGTSEEAASLPTMDITHKLAVTIYDNLMLKESEINLHWVLLNFFKQH